MGKGIWTGGSGGKIIKSKTRGKREDIYSRDTN
jgi:hypothetical protein